MGDQDVSAVSVLRRMKRTLFLLKLGLMLFGVLALFVGLYPMLFEKNLLPVALQFLPREGVGYRIVIMALGGLALLLGIRTTRH